MADVIVGNPNQNIILETAGKVYVKTGERYYELQYKEAQPTESSNIVNNITNVNEFDKSLLDDYVTEDVLNAKLARYVDKRQWVDVKNNQKKLEEAMLDGFTPSISPITINTMQLVVGSDQLQFDFVEVESDAEEDDIHFHPISAYIRPYDNCVICENGIIVHYTINGPDTVRPEMGLEEYSKWIVGDLNIENTSLDINYDWDSYYIYIKAKKYEGGDVYGEASYVVSKDAIAFDYDDEYYYLLYAIVNNQTKSVARLNGFTEILPGQVHAYIFASHDGQQVLDFLNKKLFIGDDNAYLSYEDGKLVVKGTITATEGGQIGPFVVKKDEDTGRYILTCDYENDDHDDCVFELRPNRLEFSSPSGRTIISDHVSLWGHDFYTRASNIDISTNSKINFISGGKIESICKSIKNPNIPDGNGRLIWVFDSAMYVLNENYDHLCFGLNYEMNLGQTCTVYVCANNCYATSESYTSIKFAVFHNGQITNIGPSVDLNLDYGYVYDFTVYNKVSGVYTIFVHKH